MKGPRDDPYLLINTKLGRYEVLRLIATGGTAAIYQAVDPATETVVALKVFAYSPLRFKVGATEWNLLRALEHPHIVRIYDFAVDRGLVYIVMEYVAGRSLRSVLSERGRLPLKEFTRIVLEAGSALDYAHRSGVLHLDLKPENILFTGSQRVKLLDFGSAAIHLALRGARDFVMGTPDYMSPEQIRGHPVSARTDIYGFGVLLYEMLAGHPPFRGKKVDEVLTQIVLTDPTPLMQVRPDISPELSLLISRALAKDPLLRISSVGEVVTEVLEIVGPPESDSPAVIAFLEPARKFAVRGEAQRDSEKGWTTSAGNPARTSRFAFPFPAHDRVQLREILLEIPDGWGEFAGPPVVAKRDDATAIAIAFTEGVVAFFSLEDGHRISEWDLGVPLGRGISVVPTGEILVPTRGAGLVFLSSEKGITDVVLEGEWVAPAPVRSDRIVALGTFSGKAVLFDRSAGKEVAVHQTLGSILAPPTVSPAGKFYFVSLDGSVTCFAGDGERLWTVYADHYISRYAVASETGDLYILSDTNTLTALTESGETRWQLERAVLMPPALGSRSDLMIVSRGSQLVRWSKAGSVRWAIPLPFSARHPPITDGSGNIWVSADHHILIFDAEGRWQGNLRLPDSRAFPVPVESHLIAFVCASGKAMVFTSSAVPARSSG
ncbi:MAG: protein kinase domain-containing protein [bacterium JZ-2024 1]